MDTDVLLIFGITMVLALIIKSIQLLIERMDEKDKQYEENLKNKERI
ncbi:MAG TPA: hypothetical protein PL114_08360 [Bacteroidales bacterium]|jgi:hypothetical protein|nr:hypothetical protein [Bacteroidales bacterium]HPN47925.1 hypothetical protein [Bacteroidales bacterium]HQB71437.1 hypothetical protein [Bacteroidales bacterium]